MNVQLFFNVLSAYCPLSDEFKVALEKELVYLSLPKNQFLLEAPKISTHAYFLEKGFAMGYSYYKGKKVTEYFWKSGELMVAFESFFEQTASREVIQLLKKSEVLCISFESVIALFEGFPEARRLYRAVMNKHYALSRSRLHDMQWLSARERFEKLVTRYPNIELIASQDAIASYIGITAQSLARLKRKDE